MKVKVLVAIALVSIFGAKAQSNINEYKYVTVPYFFEFVKGKNTHRLNTTTRFLLKKNGLNAFMDDELNEADYKKNNCLALRTDVVKINALLKTKLKVLLKNCNDEVVYESKVGESKAKSYDEAYREALIDAFESFSNLSYQYTPAVQEITKAGQEEKLDIVVKEETKEEKIEPERAVEEAAKKKEEIAVKKVEVVEEKQEEIQEIAEVVEEIVEAPEPINNVLYAQTLNEGYQVVDNTPKVVMILLKTSVANVFVVKDKNAIVFKENGRWFISKNVEGEIIKEPLELKF